MKGQSKWPRGTLEIWISPELDIMHGGGNAAAVRRRFTGGNPPIRAVGVKTKITGNSSADKHNVDIEKTKQNPRGANILGWHNGDSLSNVVYIVPLFNIYNGLRRDVKQRILQYAIMHEICHYWFDDVSVGKSVMSGSVDLVMDDLRRGVIPTLSPEQAQIISDRLPK